MVSTSECQLKKRTSKGKQKIEMTKAKKKESRHVTFTKRRNGMFKKCTDFCSAYDCEYATVGYSIAGKPFVSGYLYENEVIQSSIIGDNSSGGGFNLWDSPIDGLGLEELERIKTGLEGLRNDISSRVNRKNCRSDKHREITNNRGVNNASKNNNVVDQNSEYYQWMENSRTDFCPNMLPQANECLRDGDGIFLGLIDLIVPVKSTLLLIRDVLIQVMVINFRITINGQRIQFQKCIKSLRCCSLDINSCC
ncbi:hypothetical protein vseg_010782 [Gypsophila vaccaria]